MLNLNELAQWLTEVFNKQGKNVDPIYTFNIYAEVGEDKNNVDVQGILKVDIPKNIPIGGIINTRYFGDIDFTVSAPRSNYNLANVEKIIGKVAKEINGKEQTFKSGKGFITMSVAGTGAFKTEYSQGNIVPLKVKLDINYTENVVTSGGKHWYISEIGGEYIEIPFYTERVTVEKDGKVSPINDRKYKQAFMLAQQRSYMFTIPYDTAVGAMITKDILEGDANKNYKLKYIDGVAFTEKVPFETQVVLYRNGDNGETKPDTAMLNLIFTDADDGNNDTKYSLALIDNEFDGTSENTRWFDSEAEQQNWYQTRINRGADFDSIEAPNLNNLVLTNQVYKNTRNYDIFDLVNKNYAIIKVIKGENTQYFYYRVTNADIGANGQVIYTLQLDGVQTWLFRDNLIIDDSFISKAHINRWVKNSDGKTVSFNGRAYSALFEREDARNLPKRLTQRKKLKILAFEKEANPAINNINDWLNKYIFCWVYVLVGTTTMKIVNMNNGELIDHKFESTYTYYGSRTEVKYGFKLLCYPIYKQPGTGGEYIKIKDFTKDKEIFISSYGFNDFVKQNGYNDIYSVKLSVKPPFNSARNNYFNMTIDNNNCLIIGGTIETDGTIAVTEDGVTFGLEAIASNQSRFDETHIHYSYDGMFDISEDSSEPYYFDLDLTMPKMTFNILDDIVGKRRNKELNPKLNSMDYKYLRVTIGGSSFDFDIQKLNNVKLRFSYTEMITADVTKGILRLNTVSNNDIFNDEYAKSFNGFSFTNDLTLPYSTSAYETFIANNKNAYLSFQAQQNYISESTNIAQKYGTINFGISQVGNFSNLIKSAVAQDDAGVLKATGGVIGDTAKFGASMAEITERTNLNLNYQKTQFDYTIDNMKNAPDTLANANGNAIFIASVAEFGIYAELYEGLNTELESANDIMFRDGYNLNRFEENNKSIKDYCHTRKYFNYIQATLGNIHGVPMSDAMRADLKNRFAKGIRFWHQDTIDYSMENYELYLESK